MISEFMRFPRRMNVAVIGVAIATMSNTDNSFMPMWRQYIHIARSTPMEPPWDASPSYPVNFHCPVEKESMMPSPRSRTGMNISNTPFAEARK